MKCLTKEGKLIVVDYFVIPSNIQQSHGDPKPWLGGCLCQLTFLSPRPFPFGIAVSDALFISSHHPLQKRVDFVTIQQQICGWKLGPRCFFSFTHVVPIDQYLARLGKWNSTRKMVCINDFHYFNDILDNWPSTYWSCPFS